ncbi:MAG TPA: substrate-binding domain-containing protein [Ferruginibacter sp.]|nr:substrate-binding domain-containing protein [Ferruginibacter sp.]HMP21323.1 substrate-binding domain-containing protein [Ferruginibacter sp.]
MNIVLHLLRKGALQVLPVFLLFSCTQQSSTNVPADSPYSGAITISVDESFKPVIDEQIAMYEGSYPGTKITANYKPEAECIKDLLWDTATRLIIVTRSLNEKEEKYLADSLGYKPIWDRIATDALALVLHPKAADSTFTIDELRGMLDGTLKKGYQMVFDGLNATSNIRYAIDSILKGRQFDTSVVRAVKNSQAVLDYVAATPNAIGMVGISWIGNPEIKEQVEMLKKVKLAYINCSWCADSAFVKPTQLGIMSRRYPLVRGLYYIIKENYSGLGSGFVSFMRFERGQLIFRRAYLSPAKIGFHVRSVKINEHLPKD